MNGSEVAKVTTTPNMQARTAGLDNLKIFLTLLVVLHHAGQPYGPTGGAWPVMHAEKFGLLGPFFHIDASFFMGLFFMLSGYFLPAAYDRKGAARFLRERFWKLGVPILLFGLGLVPLMRHFDEGKPWSDCFLPFEYAHLWFLSHLLIYALLYTLYRQFFAASATGGQRAFPANGWILLYALALAAVDMVVRQWWPIDRWGRFIVVSELGHLPQYASLFLFGVIAASYRWIERIPERSGRLWLSVAILAVVLRFSYSIAHIHFLGGDAAWTDAVWNLWETLLCAGMCIGLPFLFQSKLAFSGQMHRFAARHAFAVYVLHLPVLVLIQKAMESTAFGPLSLTLLTGTATALICYGLAALMAAVARGAVPANRRQFQL